MKRPAQGSSLDSDQHSAAHIHGRASHLASGLGGEEHDDPGNLFWLTDPMEGNSRQILFFPLLQKSLLLGR
jgi:hypothetical protein